MALFTAVTCLLHSLASLCIDVSVCICVANKVWFIRHDDTAARTSLLSQTPISVGSIEQNVVIVACFWRLRRDEENRKNAPKMDRRNIL